MKEDEIERLIAKYKDGNSDLKEEQFLFDNPKSVKSSLKAWFTFVKRNGKKVPDNYNDKLWVSFQNKKNKKRKIFIGIMTAAASVILYLTLSIATPEQKELSYDVKENLLNEALNMVSNSTSAETKQKIIYEGNMVIIYTTTE